MQLPYGAWRPDVTGTALPYCAVADGVIPQQMGITQFGKPTIGYGPFPNLVTAATATALSGAAQGAISVVQAAGTWQLYFATSSTIQMLSSTYTWSNIETGRTLTAGDDVSFCHFGSFLLNSDTTDGFKACNVETPAGNNAVSGAPSARFIFNCNNVVFALACNGNNKRLQSSAVGDHTAWTSGGANGKTFEDGGSLICGFDLENANAVVFQDSCIRTITFGNAASPALYSIQKAVDGKGAISARSAAAFNGTIYLLMTDGFYTFDLQNGLVNIGAEKVNRWFLGQCSTANLKLVQASIDPANKLVFWRYPSPSCTSTSVFDKVIIYDWQLQEFSTATINTGWITAYQTPGITLDSMDSYGVLDVITQNLDDRFWQGGQPLFGALDANLKFATFSGSPVAATLQTTVTANPVSGQVGWCSPQSNASNSTIQLGVSDAQSTAMTWKGANSRGRAGRVPLRGRGLNIAFQENIPAGATWTYANGIDNIASSQMGPK